MAASGETFFLCRLEVCPYIGSVSLKPRSLDTDNADSEAAITASESFLIVSEANTTATALNYRSRSGQA